MIDIRRARQREQKYTKQNNKRSYLICKIRKSKEIRSYTKHKHQQRIYFRQWRSNKTSTYILLPWSLFIPLWHEEYTKILQQWVRKNILIFITVELKKFVTSNSYLPFDTLTSSDDRGICIDINLYQFFNNSVQNLTNTMAKPLKTSLSKYVGKYKHHL